MEDKDIYLKLGFMSTQDLANWAQLSSGYLSKKKKAWCEKQLYKYARYRLVTGGVEILEIYEPVYHSSAKKDVEKHFMKCFGTKDFKADQCKSVCEKIKDKLNVLTVSDETYYSYTCQTKREWFGVPKKREGTHGYCQFVYCKVVNDEFVPFTEEEDKIRKELIKKYFNKEHEEDVFTVQAAKKAYKRKEITKEELYEIIEQVSDNEIDWIGFTAEFEKTIKARTAFATLIVEDGVKLYALKDEGFEFK